MKVVKTDFEGLLILQPKIINDNRGYFCEAYNKRTLHELGLEMEFVQENQSRSCKNVIRGLHFQNAPRAQSKLVRVLYGSVLDVVVDLRKDLPTFGKWFSIELSAHEKNQLLVPKGFAHGFSILSDYAELLYLCDEYYSPEHEGGILYKDASLGIDWRVPESSRIISSRDLALPVLSEASYTF